MIYIEFFCRNSSDIAYIQNFNFGLVNIITRTIKQIMEHLK